MVRDHYDPPLSRAGNAPKRWGFGPENPGPSVPRQMRALPRDSFFATAPVRNPVPTLRPTIRGFRILRNLGPGQSTTRRATVPCYGCLHGVPSRHPDIAACRRQDSEEAVKSVSSSFRSRSHGPHISDVDLCAPWKKAQAPQRSIWKRSAIEIVGTACNLDGGRTRRRTVPSAAKYRLVQRMCQPGVDTTAPSRVLGQQRWLHARAQATAWTSSIGRAM